MTSISPWELYTIKSKSSPEQVKLIQELVSQWEHDKEKVSTLRSLGDERFPLDSSLNARELLTLWCLAIWMFDIGTAHNDFLRETYLDRIHSTISDMGFDKRAVIALSARAGKAVEILQDGS